MKTAFISSTCENLSEIREIIEMKLKDSGIDAKLSERPDFDNDPKCNPHDACLFAIDKCDVLIAIIGEQYGKEYSGNIRKLRAKELKDKFGVSPSISWMEMDYAIEKNKPIFIVMHRKIYTDIKYYRANNSKDSVLLEIKDEKVIKFIHYFNNREQAWWIKFYDSMKQLDDITNYIIKRILNDNYEWLCEEKILAEIMPEFCYKTNKKVALLNIHSKWDDYSEKLWTIKSYLFERGYEATVFESDSDVDFAIVFPKYSLLIININAYNLVKTCKIFREAKGYSDIVTIAMGSFAAENFSYLKKHMHKIIDVIIPYNNIKGICNFLLPFLNDKNDSMSAPDIKKIEQISVEKAKDFAEENSIIAMNPTIAYLQYYQKKDAYASIYTTRGCRKNCNICGVYLYRHHSIIQALDENILEQIEYLYNLGIRKIQICDEDIFCCSYKRIERLLYLMHQYFPDIYFEINFLITEQTTENQINRINKFYNYGLREITYFFCQECNAEKVLPKFKNMLVKQDNQIQTKVVIYLGKYIETEEYYDQLLELMKQYKKVIWDIRFEVPEITDGKIPNIPDYKVWTNDIQLFNSKNPIMIYTDKRKGKTSRDKRNKILEIYEFASELDEILNPRITKEVRSKFSEFSKSFNGEMIDIKEIRDLL